MFGSFWMRDAMQPVCGSEWLARATENYATIGYDVLKVSDEGRLFKGLIVRDDQHQGFFPYPLCSDV